jgi:hypothetical protein
MSTPEPGLAHPGNGAAWCIEGPSAAPLFPCVLRRAVSRGLRDELTQPSSGPRGNEAGCAAMLRCWLPPIPGMRGRG